MTDTVMTLLAERHDTYLAAFESLGRNVPQSIADLRDRGFARFSALGFPTPRLEQWRFTNVAPIAGRAFTLGEPAAVAPAAVAPYELHGVAGPRIVFVNGRFAAELSDAGSLPAGVEVGSLAAALQADPDAVTPHLGRLADFEQRAFTALNTALVQDGAVVRVPAGKVVETPLHLLFLTTAADGGMSHPRVLVVAGENSQARLVESYAGLGDAPYFTNAVTEVAAGAGAVVDHYKVIRESVDAYHVASMHVRLGRSATFSSHSITLGGALVRNDIDAELAGEGGECTLNGLYLADGARLVDNHTTIRHAMPHCASHELYKGILDGRAHAVFNGKIIVAIDAQKTDAKQTNKALLLSEDAQINTKPELEIFADDVRCTHGATVGQLDDDALFYLRTRGLGRDQARNVLIHAFAGDLLNRIAVEPIRAQLDALLLRQLPGAGGGSFDMGGDGSDEQPD